MSEKFEPLIIRKKKSGLQDKTVNIKGTNDFGRALNNSVQEFKKNEANILKKESIVTDKKKIPDSFFKAVKTAKLSQDVLLRLNTLRPFIEELEKKEKSTINDMVQLLVENYVNTRLTNRQREGYNQMYQHLFDHSKE